MENFTFHNPTRIIFGRDTESSVGSEVRKFSARILLHYGQGSAEKSGLLDRVRAALETAEVTFEELGGVVPNPRLSLVHEGIRLCREKELTFILAVGGGSVIDSAKAIALGVPYDGDVWDFYSSGGRAKEALPTGVVLTIPAAGSESSPSTVITKTEGALKRGFGAGLLRPRFAILNPELTYSLPPYQTACGAADITAHIMERYFTPTRDVDFTDRLCEATFRSIVYNVPKALDDPNDYSARANIMWAGSVAHNDLLGTGRLGDWASHGIEHEISGIYDVAHGAGLATVFPAWMKFVVSKDVDRFAQFACRVFDVEMRHFNPLETAMGGIAALEDFYRRIGMPVRLSEMDIDGSRIEEMARKSTQDDAFTLGQFAKLTSDDVSKILTLAL
ncbi:MAG: iron-containing alcohol dehydrogenase [Proteobacteria bacterium]|nr:iron-containing alcohol dehydrogenase [Pseudomonadota bacterium]